MTDKQKEIDKVLKRNINKTGLDKKVQVKYDNNKLRIVAPIESDDKEQLALLAENKNLRLVIQTGGYSESGLDKSGNPKKRNLANIRTLDITKIKSIREIK